MRVSCVLPFALSGLVSLVGVLPDDDLFLLFLAPTSAHMTDIMSNTVQGSNILDVLKKKMRQTKEEMEKYKEESEDMQKKLQVEIMRREEVRPNSLSTIILASSLFR